jgi:hypothetical protein
MGLDNRGTRIGEIPTPGQPQSSPPQNAHLRMSRGGGAGEGFGGFVHGGQAWADVALETAQAPRPSPKRQRVLRLLVEDVLIGLERILNPTLHPHKSRHHHPDSQH